MRPRILLLPLAAVVIAGLCAWRYSRPPKPVVISAETQSGYAPRGWELPDHEFNLVKFDRYLGRQPLVVWFAGPEESLDRDPVVVELVQRYDALAAAGYEVLIVTVAKPAAVRKSGEMLGQSWKFPVLTDMHLRDPAPTPVHQQWGRIDAATGAPQPGLFIVDRRGYVEYLGGRPIAAENPRETIAQLASK
jgi:peroxiredoxin